MRKEVFKIRIRNANNNRNSKKERNCQGKRIILSWNSLKRDITRNIYNNKKSKQREENYFTYLGTNCGRQAIQE
jgi:hypothetical protein